MNLRTHGWFSQLHWKEVRVTLLIYSDWLKTRQSDLNFLWELSICYLIVGSASQLSYTSSTQQTSDSSILYKTDTTQSELAAGTTFNGMSGVALNGYSGGGDGKTVFVSKTTIPRVERSTSHGTTERSFEKSSENRIGNGTSYTISYQHSTVRNVSSTLPRKQPSYTSSTSYAQVNLQHALCFLARSWAQTLFMAIDVEEICHQRRVLWLHFVFCDIFSS